MKDGFTRNEVYNAITNNDMETLSDLFGHVDLTGKDARPLLTSSMYLLAYSALGCAASVAYNGGLNGETVTFLIERTHQCLNAFYLDRLVALALGAYGTEVDYGIIPENIREACKNDDEFDDEVVTAFAEMNEEEFKAVLAFVESDEIKTISKDYNYAILTYLHMHDTVDTHTLLSIMVSSLNDPKDGILVLRML
ncbi:MAG: hypothetical protein K6F57_00015 [Candidatus Saccharibacteria bacterium]|nr:hypothetical protein [Candidatus Saccharibacteria bacterium]